MAHTRRAAPTRAEVVRGVHRMLDTLLQEPRRGAVNLDPLISEFNTLLQQARDQFRDSETLRLINALDVGASFPLIVVRLSLLTRAIDAEVARSLDEVS